MSRKHRELMLLAAADLESWMKSHRRDGATEGVVSQLREAALAEPLTDERILQEARKVGFYPGGIYSDGERFVNHNGHRCIKLVRNLLDVVGVPPSEGSQG